VRFVVGVGLLGIIEVVEVVNVPPVDVGRVNDEGSLDAIKDVISLEAIDVNNGPLGPIVYNASRRGGRTVGIKGDIVDGAVVPFVMDERSVC
jgi:hypothetical protein